MSSGWLFADGRDPDAVFTAGNAGIVTGLLHQTSGADLGSLYAAGNSGIMTKILSKTGADIGSIFANALPSLPINGGSYSGNLTIAGGTYTSRLSFNVSTSGWSLVGNTTESGSIPSGATQVECSFTQTAGNTTLTIVNIVQAAITSTTQTAYMQAQRAQSSPATNDVAAGVINFYNASGTIINQTSFTGASQA